MMKSDGRCVRHFPHVHQQNPGGFAMTIEQPPSANFNVMPSQRTNSYQPRRSPSMADLKTRQANKIREIAEALVASGFRTLDAQSRVLGLGRSTTWTILKGNHKSSGLSAKIIGRILTSSNLPSRVRGKVLEYAEDKASGRYGHSAKLRRRFVSALVATVTLQKRGRGPSDRRRRLAPRA
jgi:hypothetical protein